MGEEDCGRGLRWFLLGNERHASWQQRSHRKSDQEPRDQQLVPVVEVHPFVRGARASQAAAVGIRIWGGTHMPLEHAAKMLAGMKIIA
eukprot:2334873-Rhodomonas_salina.1